MTQRETDELFHSRISHKIRVLRGWCRVFNNAKHRMFVASYRANEDRKGEERGGGRRKSESQMGGVPTEEGVCCWGWRRDRPG